jgi:hypothetical protein
MPNASWKHIYNLCSKSMYDLLSSSLYIPHSSSEEKTDDGKENEKAEDSKKGTETVNILEWNGDIHTEKTTNKVEWHKNRGQKSDLAENPIRMIALSDVVDRKLCEVIAMSSRKHFFEMRQTGHHGNNVILNVTKIKSNIHARCDFVVGVASLRKTPQDVGFASEKLHQAHDVLANHANSAQERMHVIITSNKNLVLDRIRFIFNLLNNWRERIHDIITKG